MDVLFVSHEGSRTGAPLLLLWLVRWLAGRSDIRPTVLLLRDGPLRPEFEAVCTTFAWQPPPLYRPFRRRMADRLTGERGRKSPGELLEATIQRIDPDIVYLNSLVNGRHLSGLSENSRKRRFISHAHELNFTLLTQSTAADVDTQLNLSDVVICCSGPVQQLLVGTYDFDLNRTAVVHGYLPFHQPGDLQKSLHSSSCTAAIQQRITAVKEKGGLIFGSSGSPIMRKGFDLFPALLKACSFHFQDKDFLGIWLGCGEGSEAHLLAQTDIERLGMQEHALLLEHLPEPLPVVKAFDIFCLLSREDPYPLVVLEAAALGVPTLCFDHCGGIVDFVGTDAGRIIDYLNIERFARELRNLADDMPRLHRLGERAKEKMFAHHTIDAAAAAIKDILVAQK